MTAEDEFRITNMMGRLMPEAMIGGQSLYPRMDQDWLSDPARMAALLALVVEIDGREGHQLTLSIDLGGMLVVAARRAVLPAVIARAQAAFRHWRAVVAPRQGELVRLLGEELRAAKAELSALVTVEVGKITSERFGEVQAMIDICDFATGLSRQLYGLTSASERPGHRMAKNGIRLGRWGRSAPSTSL